MKKHKQIYFDFFGLDESCFVGCEICGAQAVDIHHIDARGMGGSKTKDFIENLQAVCRKCHIDYGDKTEFKDKLKEVHLKYMEIYGKN